jgi:hypothetical protein
MDDVQDEASRLLARPVFLIGMPRSGTTVLADILARHQSFYWLSNYQNRAPSFPFLSVINRLNDNKFVGVDLGKFRNKPKGWHRLSKLLPAQSEAHFIWAHYCGPSFPDSYMRGRTASQSEQDAFRLFLGRVGRMQGKERFFHKFTGPPRICYLQSIFPDAIFINLIRDPRAVVASLLQSGFWARGGGTTRLWWAGSGISAEDIALWQNTNLLPVALGALQWDRVVALTIEEAASVLRPDQILHLRFEDFINDPFGIMQRILTACGLAGARQIDDFLDGLSIRSAVNDKFKLQFNAEELNVISKLTRRTASLYGYQL